jgi:hypothetical protein
MQHPKNDTCLFSIQREANNSNHASILASRRRDRPPRRQSPRVGPVALQGNVSGLHAQTTAGRAGYGQLPRLSRTLRLIDRAPSGEVGERHLPLGLNQVDYEAAPVDGL